MHLIQTIDENFWWEVARKCKYATFFHTPAWHQIATQTYSNYKDVSIGVELKSEVRVVLPLLEISHIRGLFQGLVSTFAGCYGGLIADGPVTSTEAEQIYRAVRSERVGYIHITGNPIAEAINPRKGLTRRDDFTQILSLMTDFDTIFTNFSKGHKSSYKKGRRMGVTVRLATTLDDYRAYFGAYEDSLRRWGEKASSCYSWSFFKNGFKLAQTYPENIKLWLAELNGNLIAGAWVFYWNHHIDWWHGAAYEAYFDHYPNNVLQTEIIRDALEKGYKYYDFNPSGGHWNVARFKRRFGAEEWPIARWTCEDLIFRMGKKIRSMLK
jgi:CelD/BcsL family acetyltransferase involved in cellulose biosynthesis